MLAAFGTAGSNAAATAPGSTTSCGPFGLVDGSTFESAGLGEPTLIDPVNGKPSVVYFQYCHGQYHYYFIQRSALPRPPVGRPVPHPARSHASVIHPFTVSSTSSGPRTFTT